MMPLETELKIAKKIAREAGELILSHYQTNFSVEYKADQSPVTLADTAASQYILAQLAEIFPEDMAFSEESHLPAQLEGAKRVWVIDPIDGTQEFINKNGEFAVMIGLVQNQQPVLGVVYQPVGDALYFAVKGGGAYCEKQGQLRALKVSQVSHFADIRIAASRSHMSQELIDFYQDLDLNRIIQQGSVGLKFMLIADGQSELYMNMSGITSCWDTGAPQVILSEAGGQISNLSGFPLAYDFLELKNSNGIIASNGHLHQKILTKIQSRLESHYQNTLEEISGL